MHPQFFSRHATACLFCFHTRCLQLVSCRRRRGRTVRLFWSRQPSSRPPKNRHSYRSGATVSSWFAPANEPRAAAEEPLFDQSRKPRWFV